eukprot:6881785-Karenia_brevis.AAC.1
MARLTTKIWRRGARMVRSCLPVIAEEEADDQEPEVDTMLQWRLGSPNSLQLPGVDAVAPHSAATPLP